MRKKDRQRVSIIVLLLLLACLAVAYVFMGRNSSRKSSKKDTSSNSKEITLCSLKEKDIISLNFEKDDTKMSFKKDSDTWKFDDDSAFPVNQEYVSSMVKDIAGLKANKEIKNFNSDLSEYELDPANMKINIKDKSGNEKNIYIGLESAAAEGCYAYVDKPDKIYIVSSSLLSDFEYTKNQMMQMPDAPNIEAANVTLFSLSKGDKKVMTAKYDELNAKYADVEGWDISDAFKIVRPGSTEKLNELFAGLASLSYSQGVTYKDDKEQKKKYGLLNPAYTIDVEYYTVDDSESGNDKNESQDDSEEEKHIDHTFKLYIGNRDEKGENYYVSPQGEKGIFLMPATALDSLINVEPFSCLNTNIHNPNLETIKSIEITRGSKTDKIEIKRKKIEGATMIESGRDAYEHSVFLNGIEKDYESFKSLYNAEFERLAYSGVLGDKGKSKDTQEILSMKIVTDNDTRIFKFLPYDDVNYYKVEEDGKVEFLAEINVVEKVVKNLLGLKEKEKGDKKD